MNKILGRIACRIRYFFVSLCPTFNYGHIGMMRKLLMMLVMMTSFAATVKADALSYTKEHPLLFGIDMDYPPMQFIDTDGKANGYDVEFTRELLKHLDIPFTYAPNAWANIADDILEGRVDLGMMVYSSYRKDITNYSRAVFRLYYQLVTRQDGPKMDGLRTAENHTFALMRSRPILDTLASAGAKTVIVTDLTKTMKELSAGKYDAVICFRYQARYIIGGNGLDNLVATDLALSPREYCYVSHNKELIDAINVALDELEADGTLDKVYANVKTSFDSREVPIWVWYLLAALIFGFMLVVIVQQARHHLRLRSEVKRAQRSEHLKTVFLGNVSHALRTPLNAIIGFSDMLRDNGELLSEADRHEMLDHINKNGHQLLHFIEELLELSDIEGADQLFDRIEIDLQEVMDEFADAVRPNLAKGVMLKVVGHGGHSVLDPNLLRYIMSHLLNNAVENTKDGEIMLKYGEVKHCLYVEVRDTGTGIPEELRKNLFSLLSDKKTFVQDKVPGLGLSICKAIVERTGGQMGAESPKEGGTVVWFWVPREIHH